MVFEEGANAHSLALSDDCTLPFSVGSLEDATKTFFSKRPLIAVNFTP
jgi:hypothetical protein